MRAAFEVRIGEGFIAQGALTQIQKTGKKFVVNRINIFHGLMFLRAENFLEWWWAEERKQLCLEGEYLERNEIGVNSFEGVDQGEL